MKDRNIKKLSIIIITLNEEKNIGNILNDLLLQTFQDYEIIVSDSNSTDNTKYVVKSYKQKIKNLYFKNCKKTLGPSYGRNYGESFAKHEHLLFLDADTRIKNKNFLKEFLRISQKQNIDTGSMYLKPINKTSPLLVGYSLINLGFFITQFLSPTAVGAFMFSTKTVHKKINGFRENVFLCEDCDYVRDAKRQGFKVKMVPLSIGFSDRRLSKQGLIKMGLLYLRANLIRFWTGNSISKNKIKYEFEKY